MGLIAIVSKVKELSQGTLITSGGEKNQSPFSLTVFLAGPVVPSGQVRCLVFRLLLSESVRGNLLC